MLIHQMADHRGGARRPPRPFALFVSFDQARLRLQPRNVGRIVRISQPIDERAGAAELSRAIDQDQRCVHHTVSASILTYSGSSGKRWVWLRSSHLTC
jgi:hypothetical protein